MFRQVIRRLLPCLVAGMMCVGKGKPKFLPLSFDFFHLLFTFSFFIEKGSRNSDQGRLSKSLSLHVFYFFCLFIYKVDPVEKDHRYQHSC
jgi:hypothetical protein